MDTRAQRVDRVRSRPVSRGVLEPHSVSVTGCGAIILSKSTMRCLFLLRSIKQAGTWGLPGGKIEGNELPLAGLLREIREETSFDLNDKKLVPIETFTSENNRFLYHTFLIIVEDEFIPQLNEEHKGFCWVNIDDYPRPLHAGVYRTIKINEIIEKVKTIEEIYR